MSEEYKPLDTFEVSMLLSQEATLVYFFALEVGPSVSVGEVFEVAQLRQSKLPERSLKRLSEMRVEQQLKMLVLVGLMMHEAGRYVFTEAALDNTVRGIIGGCTEEEIESTPKWLHERIAVASAEYEAALSVALAANAAFARANS